MSVVDKILLAQSLVRQAEAGEIDWRRLYDAVFDDKIEGPWTTVAYVSDLYFRFRLTEAAAHKFRQEQPAFPSIAVSNMVALCHTQTVNIHEALRYNEGLTPSTPLEEMGKFAVEEKLRWALDLFDAFNSWGY